MPALERGRVRAQGAAQSVLLEVARPKLEDERAHLGQGLALQVAQLRHLGPGGGRIAVEQHLDRARHEGHREERLGHRVVQLAGQVGALLAGGQLARLAAQVALEPVALADVAGGTVGADEHAVVGHARCR